MKASELQVGDTYRTTYNTYKVNSVSVLPDGTIHVTLAMPGVYISKLLEPDEHVLL